MAWNSVKGREIVGRSLWVAHILSNRVFVFDFVDGHDPKTCA